MRRALKVFESAPGLIRSAIDWKELLGADYQIVKPFLRLRKGLATSVPCPAKPPCGCDHAVIEHGRDDIVSVCRCGPKVCPPTKVKREDVLIYELNVASFGNTIADTLNIKSEDKTVEELSATRMIGIFSPNSVIKIPIFLTIQWDPAAFRHAVEYLVAKTQTPFILLAPTESLYTNELHQMLHLHRARFLALDAILAWNGKFIAPDTLENIFSEFLEEVAPSKELYGLYKEGKTWRTVFEGETNSILDSKGMDYIATLLVNPHKSIPCAELYGAVLVPLAEVSGEFVDDYQQIPKKSKTLNVDAVSDKKTKSNCEQRISDIESEIEIAKDTGNTEKIAPLEYEKKALQQEISRSEGLRGKLRVSGKPEKARQAVTRAVERAIQSMEKQHPKLWVHLRSTVTTGNTLTYKPDRAIRWSIKR